MLKSLVGDNFVCARGERKKGWKKRYRILSLSLSSLSLSLSLSLLSLHLFGYTCRNEEKKFFFTFFLSFFLSSASLSFFSGKVEGGEEKVESDILKKL